MSDTSFILYLPDVALEKIFSYLSYDEIAKNRLICREFNELGSRLLSRGFIQVEKRHNAIFKRVKSLLPRRESERRLHPLSRHSDILQAVETRISMLNMTYMRYIESNLLCFIPGKVLDEILKVLDMLEDDCIPQRNHQILQELRDLSSMAMEHFDEHILPGVKENKEKIDCSRRQEMILPSNHPSTTTSQNNTNRVRDTIQMIKFKNLYKLYKHQVHFLNQHTLQLAQKVQKQNRILRSQSIKMREQERKMHEQSVKIQEQGNAIGDLKKHFEDWEQKYKDLTSEFKTREDLIIKKVSTTPTDDKKTPVILLPTSIKPRVADIFHNNYLLNLERKRKTNLLPEIQVKKTKSNDEQQKVNKRLMLPRRSFDSNNHLTNLINELIKKPLTTIKSRKRKTNEELNHGNKQPK